MTDDFVAAMGENPRFVAFMAHLWFAWALVASWPNLGTGWRAGIAVLISLATAVKEFWFDANYEKAPVQTALDNERDYAGYLTGAWAAVIFCWIV